VHCASSIVDHTKGKKPAFEYDINAITQAIKYLKIVIPAKAGIQVGLDAGSVMTGVVYLVAR